MKLSEAPKFLKKQPLRFEGDTGTASLKAHNTITIEARARTSTGHATVVGARVLDQTPLDRYHLRGQLDKDRHRNSLMFEAGERLRSDFYHAGLQSHAKSTLERVSSSARDPVSHMVVECLADYKAALAAIPASLRSILVHVCCLEHPASDWATQEKHPKEAGITVLRLALDELGVHYGLFKARC